MSDDETAEDPSTKVNLFGTLMPLIVELKDLVEKPCFLECGNFLLRVLQSEKQSISNTSNGNVSTTNSDAGSHLLYLAFELQNVLSNSPKSRTAIDCCVMYLEHLVQKAKSENPFTGDDRPLKRRKV